jgi:hypothetical protein
MFVPYQHTTLHNLNKVLWAFMRITHVVRQYVPYHGGLETSVHNLARQQVKLGHSVKVVTLARRLHGQSEKLPQIFAILVPHAIRSRRRRFCILFEQIFYTFTR